MNNEKKIHLNYNQTNVHKNDFCQEKLYVFELKDFIPEIYDCEADGSCGSGHQHTNNRV